MNRLSVVTLLVLTSGATVAAAQPRPVPAPTPAPVPTPTPTPAPEAEPPPEEPAPAPEPPPPPSPDDLDEPPDRSPAPVPPSAAPVVAPPPRVTRPQQFSVGLGLGWGLPADLQAPNTASARFRMASGLTVEPRLVLARGDSSVDDGVPPPNELTTTQLSIGLLVRKPLRSNGKADFELLGSLALDQQGFDPDGSDNATSTTGFAIGYGVAVTYWLTPHLQVSMTGINPVFTTIKRTEELGPDMDVITTSTAIGAVFDPTFIAMLHLYL